ncbi:DUF2735 domain-containing protein [Ensifer soli]|uniref:DUF2735 domain-containing protein n=1 Tax=Ciceribacter sp. sgz301302 TaxID=3342379 RepID=UPI0035BA0228
MPRASLSSERLTSGISARAGGSPGAGGTFGQASGSVVWGCLKLLQFPHFQPCCLRARQVLTGIRHRPSMSLSFGENARRASAFLKAEFPSTKRQPRIKPKIYANGIFFSQTGEILSSYAIFLLKGCRGIHNQKRKSTMNLGFQKPTAKIYQFPVRPKAFGSDRSQWMRHSVQYRGQTVPSTDFGSGWYHDAAIAQEGDAKKNA